MKILTVENQSYELDNIPETADDIRFSIPDYTDPKNVDYYFIPLMFLESFYAPAAVLKIGENVISMPLDWHMVICDPEIGDPEIISIMSLNDRDFSTFCINPISSFNPEFLEVQMVNVYQDVKWHVPKLKYGHLLCVPLNDSPKPPCAIFVKETNKIPEVLDINEIW